MKASGDNILDELNVLRKHSKIRARLTKRKGSSLITTEVIFLSAFVFRAEKKDLKPSRLILTNMSIYFLRKKLLCCGSGLTFSEKYQTKDMLDLTICKQENSLIVKMHMEDDIYIQLGSASQMGESSHRDRENTFESTNGLHKNVEHSPFGYIPTESTVFLNRSSVKCLEKK